MESIQDYLFPKNKGRKKKIVVRHRNLTGDEIELQRKVINWWIAWFLPVLLTKWGYVWKPWILMNHILFEREEKIAKMLDQIVNLQNECFEIEQLLKREKRDVDNATRQTRGYSVPFEMEVPVQYLPFKKQNWMHRPSGDWRKYLNPKAFKNLQGTEKPSVREKVGADERPYATRSAYIPSDMSKFKATIESDTDFDHVMSYKEPQPKKNNNNNQNNNNNNQRNRNRNRNNNNQNDDNDSEDYDD